MKPIYKYLALGAISIFLLYSSVYFKPLDEVIAKREATKFDPVSYAHKAFARLMANTNETAIPIEKLWNELTADPQNACKNHGRELGISNKCYFMIQGEGTILEMDDEGVLIQNQQKDFQVKIATEFIFGNAIRDASGEVPVSDFTSIMDFNKVAEEMNKKVREEIVSPFLKKASEGDLVRFVIAAPVRKDKPFSLPLNAIPVSLILQ